MFEMPGFDPKTLTDEQLMDRSHELSSKIVWASQNGSGGGVDMMMRMADMIDAERRERAFMANWATQEPTARDPIYGDPDDRDEAKRKQSPSSPSTRVKQTRFGGMRRPVPTATPRMAVEPMARDDESAPSPTAAPKPEPAPPGKSTP